MSVSKSKSMGMSKINWKQVGFDFARIQLFGWSVLDIVQKAEKGQALTPAENKILQGFTERAKDLELASVDRQLQYHTQAIKSLLSQRTKCLPKPKETVELRLPGTAKLIR